MHTDRLLALATYFENRNEQAKKEGFSSASFGNMQTWVGNPAGFLELACPDEGFRLIPDGDGMYHSYDSDSDTIGWKAVANFLDIQIYEAQQLFSYYFYNPNPGMLEVAERVRSFVNASPGA